ncbi:MAG: AAA family ATPase [Actinomycetota bacterium]|nr:AAA family ATPase [Actinomycetota bacterium]
MLAGRATEMSALADLLAAARAGRAGVLHLVGEAGIGKTALVSDVVARASDCRVLHAVGARGESNIPFAGLQALLYPLQDLVPELPPAQGHAAATALGLLEPGKAVGELVIGAACLQLIALAAEQAPVLVVADDLQWFDEESWRALSFAVRRIAGERIGVVLATRPGSRRQVEGVPTLHLGGLGEADAVALLRGVRSDLALDVCRQVHARTGGNSLAMVEAARGLSPLQVSGAARLPETLPTSKDLAAYFWARSATCPPATQALLLLAALEGRGDLSVLAAAADRLGLRLSALGPAEREGLVSVAEQRLAFRHPLVAAAILHEVSPEDRRAAHAVLAAVITADANRAAWHAASACLDPDAAAADALADVADRAQVSSAPAAASAAFERAAGLSPDPSVAAERLLLAAEAALLAGATERASSLASRIACDLLPESWRGRPALVQGRAAMLLGRPSEAGLLLLEASRGLDLRAAAAALAAAVAAALETGDLEFATQLVIEAERLRPEAHDLVLALHVDRARAALIGLAGDAAESARVLHGAIDALADSRAIGEDSAVWLALALASCAVGDLPSGRRRFVTAAVHARSHGDMLGLVQALAGEAFAEHLLGRWTSAYATGVRALELTDEDRAPYLLADVLQILAEIDAARGHEDSCRRRCDRVRGIAGRLGLRQLAILAERREALLDLGLNRLDGAAVRLLRIRQEFDRLGLRHAYLSPIPDLVEVYVRAGMLAEAEELVPEFAALAGPAFPTAHARLLRSRALVAGRDEYPALFEESVALDAASGLDFLRARTLLCYGERLRRDRQRVAARAMLRGSLEVFDGLEALPWAKRARVELAATGETPGPRQVSPSEQLTPQELQIAMLVAEGLRNKKIATTLFLSVRTVEFHLTRVYRKLGVATRAELASRLARGLPSSPRP